jgi:hypothetical protein
MAKSSLFFAMQNVVHGQSRHPGTSRHSVAIGVKADIKQGSLSKLDL